MTLLIEESIVRVERALLDAVTLGMLVRLPPVPDVPALRATPTQGASGSARRDGDLVFVTSAGGCYRWSVTSTATDDGALVIRPADAGATGRWLLASSTARLGGQYLHQIPTGILRTALLHNGDFSDEVLQSRIFGQAPCVAIHFGGEDHQALSQVPGALYRYRADFELWSVSRNYRSGPEAALGSPISAEAAADPGVMAIHGQLKRLLAGVDLGVSGIEQVEIGRGHLEQASEAERLFVMSLAVQVRGAVHSPDADGEHVLVTGVDAQPYVTDLHGEVAFDPANHVVSGIDVNLGLGLAHTVSAGSAYVGGQLVLVAETPVTFVESADTYRDLLPDGSLAFTAVSIGGEPPPVAPGALRVGVTTTDSAGVVAERYLVAISYPFGRSVPIDLDLVAGESAPSPQGGRRLAAEDLPATIQVIRFLADGRLGLPHGGEAEVAASLALVRGPCLAGVLVSILLPGQEVPWPEDLVPGEERWLLPGGGTGAWSDVPPGWTRLVGLATARDRFWFQPGFLLAKDS